MSIRCQNWVYEYSEARGNDRLVLLAIADEADDDGTNAYPGIKRIAHKARVPERTVMRSLERLESDGYLVVRRPDERGRGRFNSYVVIMENGNRDARKGDTLTPMSGPPHASTSAPENVPERRAKARKGAPPYLNRRRPPDPGPVTPVLNESHDDAGPPTPDLREGSEVQEPHTADPGAELLAAVAEAAPAACRWELLDDPDQAAGRSALRRRLVLMAAEVGDAGAVSIVASEWPATVASAMAHANARARAHLEPASAAVGSRRPPDPLDGIAAATAALAERAVARQLELAHEPLGLPPPSWKDHLLARLHGVRTDG